MYNLGICALVHYNGMLGSRKIAYKPNKHCTCTQPDFVIFSFTLAASFHCCLSSLAKYDAS